jgi:hypothetical protein
MHDSAHYNSTDLFVTSAVETTRLAAWSRETIKRNRSG